MRPAPDYIQFYPTTRCNLSCGFCFNQQAPEMRDMSFEAFKALADRMKQLGIRTLDILGGEPTLHQDLMRMLGYGLEQGLAMNISSNGSDISFLSDIMVKYPRVAVGVSVNDRKNAERMNRFIRNTRPVVKTVLGNLLDRELIETLLACKPREFYLIYQDAMERKQLGQTVPFDAFLRTVRSRFDPGQVGMVYCSGFLPDHEQYPELIRARCPAGTTKLAVLPDGSVYPCNLLFGREEYRLGNFLTDPFEEIWQHPLLTWFRAFMGNKCPRTDCELFRSCHGGCPAHSIAHYGKRSAPEPRCVRP
ncbi:MAG: SPASM domain-containing protein [Nitrospirota bacterium]|nr:SPASM domain-containing protein [Nitrospirota bacterium]